MSAAGGATRGPVVQRARRFLYQLEMVFGKGVAYQSNRRPKATGAFFPETKSLLDELGELESIHWSPN